MTGALLHAGLVAAGVLDALTLHGLDSVGEHPHRQRRPDERAHDRNDLHPCTGLVGGLRHARSLRPRTHTALARLAPGHCALHGHLRRRYSLLRPGLATGNLGRPALATQGAARVSILTAPSAPGAEPGAVSAPSAEKVAAKRPSNGHLRPRKWHSEPGGLEFYLVRRGVRHCFDPSIAHPLTRQYSKRSKPPELNKC